MPLFVYTNFIPVHPDKLESKSKTTLVYDDVKTSEPVFVTLFKVALELFKAATV